MEFKLKQNPKGTIAKWISYFSVWFSGINLSNLENEIQIRQFCENDCTHCGGGYMITADNKVDKMMR